jgi:hypothetical protein
MMCRFGVVVVVRGQEQGEKVVKLYATVLCAREKNEQSAIEKHDRRALALANRYSRRRQSNRKGEKEKASEEKTRRRTAKQDETEQRKGCEH